MANSIALAQKYLPLLDEVYKRSSLTANLDLANDMVKFDGSDTVKIFKTSMNGLGNYSRTNGFVDGDVTGTWESLKLTKDRARSFSIDRMDNEETLGQAFGTLAGEFIRTQVVPEIDAYRFATYAGTANILSAQADIAAGTDVVALIDTAEAEMGDNEVPYEGRILFVSEATYKALKSKITRYVDNSVVGVNREIEVYDNMPVVRVPKGRFNTGITLYDGTSSGQTAGGYTVPKSTSYAINFMIVHPSAVVQVTKHTMLRVFEPDVNQQKDAWKFDYRIYHDAFVLENKVKGIYLHKAATANA